MLPPHGSLGSRQSHPTLILIRVHLGRHQQSAVGDKSGENLSAYCMLPLLWDLVSCRLLTLAPQRTRSSCRAQSGGVRPPGISPRAQVSSNLPSALRPKLIAKLEAHCIANVAILLSCTPCLVLYSFYLFANLQSVRLWTVCTGERAGHALLGWLSVAWLWLQQAWYTVLRWGDRAVYHLNIAWNWIVGFVTHAAMRMKHAVQGH